MKTQEKIQKKNLPELKLAKIKAKPDSDSENEYRGKSINNKQLNNKSLLSKKKKSHSLRKINDLVFPKINSNINEFDYYDKKYALNNIHNNHNAHNIQKKKNNFGQHNVNNNIALLQAGFLKNDKNKDFEGDKNDKLHTKNEALNIQKVKTKIPKPQSNNIKNIHQPKLKSIKKEPSNIINDNKNLLINQIQNIHNNTNHLKPLIPSNNNKINTFNNNISSPSLVANPINTTTNKTSLISNINSNSPSSPVENQINTPINIDPLSPSENSTSSSSSIANELKEMELLTEKINLLRNIFSSLSFLNNPPAKKTVNITPEIFNNTYKNFETSIISKNDDIKEGEIIKGFGYNSSMGNIRDYNEDTITATKITLNDDENNYFYFFGVYDGHGGKGCSFYLRDNLHKNINEFSSNGIKLGIEKTEENFIKNEALNENGELKDSSGSCGIIAIIKGKKLIIGNVGDSRLVIFKNGLVSFATEDHKPDSDVEKKRIEAAGGKIYQTPSYFPLYQNGKEIEIPWRVLPGRLSVSRTFGDIEAKEEKFGGMKGVVAALPDITEIELNEEYNFIVIGCDGIFDVLSNEELLECVKIVLKEKKIK
jgi:serine/threonine protein phosphatase PrpC